MMTRLQMLVGILAEEATEVGKVCSKIQRFGLMSYNPDYNETNAAALRAELNDLYAMVLMLNEEFALGYSGDRSLMDLKRNKVNKWAKLSIELGQVQP